MEKPYPPIEWDDKYRDAVFDAFAAGVKEGWSDVLKLILTQGACKYVDTAVYSQGEFRDYLEAELHKIEKENDDTIAK